MEFEEIFDIVSPKVAIEYYKSSINTINEMDLSKEEKAMHKMMYILAIKAVMEVSGLDKE